MDEDKQRAQVRQQLIHTCNAVLPPAAAKLGLDTSDESVRLALVQLATRIFNAGIRAGGSQVIAQAIEQGAQVHVNWDASLLPPTAT
jgi:hypothetical protein